MNDEWWRDDIAIKHAVYRNNNTLFLVSKEAIIFQDILNIVTGHLRIQFFQCSFCPIVFFRSVKVNTIEVCEPCEENIFRIGDVVPSSH